MKKFPELFVEVRKNGTKRNENKGTNENRRMIERRVGELSAGDLPRPFFDRVETKN